MDKRIVVVLALICLGFVLTGTALAQEEKKEPPCSALEHSQFDFWVGKWRVTDEAGTFQGTNRIEKILDGCVEDFE